MTIVGDYAPSPRGWVREQVQAFEDSDGVTGNMMQGLPVVVVTMRGHRSGKIRKVPLMRVEHDGVYAIVASLGGAPDNPKWYYNLIAEPTCSLQDGADHYPVTAREVYGEEKATWWARAVEAYPDYANYQEKTTRDIPVFVLDPAE